ncbi:glycosyltransferase [Methylomonas sp. LL1]|uniref:glycosyltransferase n=1 Tax=Methylomonas sp. LL1 TaxID=2785785 RepID=UPI0018C38C82|nr:glycosyltransferase [Methylomonas sp. LL1]QPK65319.1 glycosyltransferase [Methylomonas sp. LL1]
MQPRISVIATVRNEADSIAVFVESLLTQSKPADEIIIVDGDSHDGTNEILQEYEHKGKVKLITKSCNIAEGRNIAIRNTTSDIIAVTDAGCRPDTDWLFKITKPLLDDLQIHAVSGKIIPETETYVEYYCGLLSLPDHTTDEQANLFYGRCSAFRRLLWEKVNGYPEWLYTAEDSLFALAARKQGFNVAHAEDAIIFWKPRDSLKKIAKMFFLYGKGNGRINWGSINGTLYWLRNHACLIASIILSLFYPIFWLASIAIGFYLYQQIAKPSLTKVRKIDHGWRRELYVPLITYLRNLSTNLGFLYGYFEYKKNPVFKNKLDNYLNLEN